MSESRDTRPRLVVLGGNIETRVSLQGLLDAGANVVALVTLPAGDGRGVSDYEDMHPLCEEHGVATIDTRDINAAETLDALRAVKPDYVFVPGWSQLLREDALSIPSGFAVGSHPSPLPLGRGRAPVPWTILQGQERSAVSLFRMDVGADSGLLLSQRWFDVAPNAYAADVYDTVAEVLRDSFIALYHAIEAGTVETRTQDESAATHRAKRTPADGHVDFTWEAASIGRLIRAVAEPYPGAYAYYQGRKITIWRVSLDGTPPYVGTPGQILKREGERILVHAGDRPLWLWQFTEAGEPLEAKALRVGQRFGYRIEDELYELRRRVAELEAGARS